MHNQANRVSLQDSSFKDILWGWGVFESADNSRFIDQTTVVTVQVFVVKIDKGK